jgi:3-oxoacyl-[acyl-carrier-protein] synthase II
MSIRNGFMGINYVTVFACATSNTAIMDAYHEIRLEQVKIRVTGGPEAPITLASIGGVCTMKAMFIRNEGRAPASWSFDVERDGFVIGEGAGSLILEDTNT